MSVIHTREQAPQIIPVGAGRARRPMARPAAQEAGLSGRDVLKILRKRKWLIIVSLVVCISLSIAATLLLLEYRPSYTSLAVLKVRPERATIIRPTAPVVSAPWMDALAAEAVSLTKSERVLQAAINRDEVRNTTWFQEDPDGAIQRLSDDLSVSPRPGSALVVISLSGSRQDELPEIVNAVATEAVLRATELATQGTQSQIRLLTSEKADLDEQRDLVRAEKAKLLRDADVPDILDRANVMTLKLHGLSPQVTGMELEYAQSDASLEMIRKQVQSGQIESLPQVIQAMDYDWALRHLRSSMLNQRARRYALEAKFGPNHRAVKDYEAQVKQMEMQIGLREKVLVDAQVNSLIANAESRKAIVLERLTTLRDQYRFVDLSVRGMRATYSRYTQLDTRDTALTEDVARIDGRLVDLRMLLKGSEPLTVLQEAARAREPSFPRWEIMVAIGVALGLLVGLGLAFTLEMVDTSIKGPADITRRVDLPLLGMVPHQDDLEENIKDLRMAFSTHPNSLVSEAFRQIRTCLQFSGPASQRRTLLVTSPQPEDGRTTVSLNLAASAARNGRKVLVVDANFRQPMIRALFPAAPEGGLSTALVGQANWRDMILDIEPNFSIMASGPLPPNPGELLGSEQMSAMVSEMVAEYDQIIFDSAPCLLLTDAAALSTLVDGVLLVVRAGANTHGIVQRTRETLNRIGGHVVGVVLNGVRAIAGGYLRKNYEAFYDYHERAKLPQK
ncbi:MAG: polysaccharide biosynthesis tyrosine autokinase [Phycisphaerae bacterium]